MTTREPLTTRLCPRRLCPRLFVFANRTKWLFVRVRARVRACTNVAGVRLHDCAWLFHCLKLLGLTWCLRVFSGPAPTIPGPPTLEIPHGDEFSPRPPPPPLTPTATRPAGLAGLTSLPPTSVFPFLAAYLTFLLIRFALQQLAVAVVSGTSGMAAVGP